MLGIDIIEVKDKRIDNIYKLLTNEEKNYVDRSVNPDRRREVLAGIFAAKEAVFKALDLKNIGLEVLKNIEILHKDNGRPYVVYMGKKLDIELSISHTKLTAVAIAYSFS